MTKDTRLGYYRGTIVEILNTFLATQLAVVPRKHNMQAHSLAMFSNTCRLPISTLLRSGTDLQSQIMCRTGKYSQMIDR